MSEDATGEQQECDCCEINDYCGEDYEPCENCGHSIEEHG
jgi:hypothetical protein